MADKPKFFELIKPNHNIDFVGKSRWLLVFSTLLCIASIVLLPVNRYVLKSRGHLLNFSIDFRGGTEMKIQFTRPVLPSQIISALDERGIKEAEVSPITDFPNTYLVRFSAVSTLSDAEQQKLKTAFETQLGKENLRMFRYQTEDGRIVLRLQKGVEVSQIQTILASSHIQVSQDLIQTTTSPDESKTYIISTPGLSQEVRAALESKLGAGTVAGSQGDSVGAKAGKELRDNGVISLLAAIGFIMLYVLVRFDFRYAPGTVVALLHDAILVIGAFALSYKEFSLTTIAAILTVIGYSMNDTIVVFDRIRENTTRFKEMSFRKVVNLSINETLSRTILTSATVFIVTLAMNIWGTGVIRDFGFAMNVGVIVGTYSSIFVASPVLIWLHERTAGKKK